MKEKSTKYITKALKIFKQEGLGLSLEELAERMAISKKTIYNHFHSKEELHSACMQSMFMNLNQKMDVLTDDSKNAIECMREGFNEISEIFLQLSPLFIYDLQKIYPDMINSTHANDLDFFNEKIKLNLKKGIKEGLYNPKLDIAFFSQYISHSIFGFFFHSMLTGKKVLTNNYFSTVLEFNLNALATEKGSQYLKNKNQ